MPPGSVAGHCKSCSAHCPQAVKQCITGVALPTAPGQCGSASQELHCQLPPGSVAGHCRNCTAHCPQAVNQCITGVPLPIAPRRCGSALQELHCPLPPGGGGGGGAPAVVPRTVSRGVVPRGPHAGSAEGVLRLTSARVKRISSHT